MQDHLPGLSLSKPDLLMHCLPRPRAHKVWNLKKRFFRYHFVVLKILFLEITNYFVKYVLNYKPKMSETEGGFQADGEGEVDENGNQNSEKGN